MACISDALKAGLKPYGIGDVTGTVTAGFSILSAASGLLCLYHGYKRNCGSIPWALAWGLAGSMFPVIAPTFGVLQGLGKPLPKCLMR